MRRGILAIASLAVGACYGFAGGGFPSEIRTVAVLPFDNLTSEPTLSQEILTAVREAVESRLGLRPAGEGQADAIVQGTITRYQPDLPVAFQAGEGNRVDVTRRLVQITVSVEILDQRANKPLWQRRNLTVEGDYQTGREQEGREKALDKLITDIVDGAQSQW